MEQPIKKIVEPKVSYTKEDLDKADFSLSKNYQWDLGESFAFTGKEFEMLFRELSTYVNTPISVGSSIKILALYHLIENKFKVGLLEGKIRELSQEETENFQKMLEKNSQEIEYEEIKDVDLAVEG